MKIVPFLAYLWNNLSSGGIIKRGDKMDFNINGDTNRLRLLVNWIVDVAVVISIAWFTVFALGTQITNSGQSMTPILEAEEVVLMNRLVYHIRKPERYDIVAFEKSDKKLNIKRVVGLPGETVQIKEGFIYINDKKLDNEEGLNKVDLAGFAENPVKLEKDEYFLLGDNRDNSEDSRFANVGNVKRSQIKGKVWLRISPILHFGVIRS